MKIIKPIFRNFVLKLEKITPLPIISGCSISIYKHFHDENQRTTRKSLKI